MGFGYHYHAVIRAGESAELERRHAHRRALTEAELERFAHRQQHSLMARAKARLPKRRLQTGSPGALILDGYELTASACRLEDGSMGHIAIRRQSDEDWSAVCIRA